MHHDVFISYSKNDKAIADALVHFLEESRIRCWIAPRDVPPGFDYAEAIDAAVRDAPIFLLVFSGSSQKSGHCRSEVVLAVDYCKVILPVKIDDAVPSGAMHYHLGNKHWIDAFPRPDEHFKRIRDSVTRNLRPGVQPDEPDGPDEGDWYNRLSVKMKVFWHLKTCFSAFLYLAGWVHMIFGFAWIFKAKMKYDIPVGYLVVSLPIGGLLFMVAAIIGSKEPKQVVKSVVLWLRDLLRGYVRIDIVTITSNFFRVLGGVYLMLFGLIVPGVIVYALILPKDYELLVRFVSLSGFGFGAYVLGTRLLMRRKIDATRGSFVKWLIIIGMPLLLMLFQQGRGNSNLRQEQDDAGPTGGSASHAMEDVLVNTALNFFKNEEWDKAFEMAKKTDMKNRVLQFYVGTCYFYNRGGAGLDLYKAREWFEKSARQELADAQYNMGHMVWFGKGGASNLVEAVEWYRRAAERGHVNAQVQLAQFYKHGTVVKQDLNQSFKWYEKAAVQGNVDAQLNVGLCYEQGIGCEANGVKAFEWYRRAATQGDLNAQNNLGRAYALGIGVPTNVTEALRWYSQAAEAGHAVAELNAGIFYLNGTGVRKDVSMALSLITKAAEQNVPGAEYVLGVLYDNGVKGDVEVDEGQACRWLSKFVEDGRSDPQIKEEQILDASIRISFIYSHKGEFALAKKYLKKPAEKNIPIALFKMGYIALKEGNVADAINWYGQAAKNGFVPAYHQLGVIYETKEWGFQNDEKAFAFHKKAFELNDWDSAFRLGILYVSGRGPRCDQKERRRMAIYYLQNALKSEDADVRGDAKKLLDALKRE